MYPLCVSTKARFKQLPTDIPLWFLYLQGHSSALHAGLNQSQRALMGTISSALSGIQNAQDEIDGRIDLPSIGDDAVSLLVL